MSKANIDFELVNGTSVSILCYNWCESHNHVYFSLQIRLSVVVKRHSKSLLCVLREKKNLFTAELRKTQCSLPVTRKCFQD